MVTHRILAYLIGLALGYWVLTHAAKQKGFEKLVGKIIAWIIIVISLCGPLCIAGSALVCKGHGGGCCFSSCPMDGHMMGGGCPDMGKGMMDNKGMGGDQNKPK